MKRIMILLAFAGSILQSCDKIVAQGDPGHDEPGMYYKVPEVNLTVDEVPASGGVVKKGVVTYRQVCVISDGKHTRDSVITEGAVISYGDPVNVASAGSEVYADSRKVGTFSVSVTLNGETGYAEADVYQAPNGVESFEVLLSSASLKIGESCQASTNAIYSSGHKSPCQAMYTCSTGNLTISGSTITGHSCGLEGTSCKLVATVDGQTAEKEMKVTPYVKSLTYKGGVNFKTGVYVYEDAYSLMANVILDAGTNVAEEHDVAGCDCVVVFNADANLVKCEKGNVYALKAGIAQVRFIYFDKNADVSLKIM